MSGTYNEELENSTDNCIPQEDVKHMCLLPEELESSGERETMAEKLHVSVLC